MVDVILPLYIILMRLNGSVEDRRLQKTTDINKKHHLVFRIASVK